MKITPEAVVRLVQGDMRADGYYSGEIDADWGPGCIGGFAQLRADAAKGRAVPGTKGGPSKRLSDSDIVAAAADLGCTVAQLRAVDQVESTGGGLEPARADIIAIDGPGGFIDGPDLPKILFEATPFHNDTGGKYDVTHPNLSAPKWNRALYVGGQGEWTRLWRAMQLDRTAALRSASWGRYQIMGFNHKLAGHDSVESFVAAMKTGELAHLQAFIAFIRSSGLVDELKAISSNPETCRAFAKGYNGPGYAANDYHGKIARAHAKWGG